jgi:hypothetical protein
LLISAVNIGMALFAGNYLLRNLHHISLFHKVAAGTGLAFYGVFVLTFNLATAHYRALLEIDPVTALVDTLPSLRQGPFDFDNFDAAILLFIGMIFAVAAMIKSYKADSFYPGHGARDRRHKDAEEEYRDVRENAQNDAYQVLEDGSATADKVVSEARRAAYEQPIIVDQLEKFSREYGHYIASLYEAQKTLLQSYREKNTKIRPSPPPSYFTTYPNIEADGSLPLDRLPKMRSEAEKADEFLNEIEKEVANFSKNIRKLDSVVNEEINSFITLIEEEAALEVDQGRNIEGMG